LPELIFCPCVETWKYLFLVMQKVIYRFFNKYMLVNTMDRYQFSVVIEKDEDGYFAYCPEIQGCYTQGDTYEEALENLRDAIHLCIEDILESGEPIPKNEFISLTTLEVTA